MISPRPRATLAWRIALSVLFAVLGGTILLVDSQLIAPPQAGATAVATVRVANFDATNHCSSASSEHTPVVVRRGETIRPELVPRLLCLQSNKPRGQAAWLAFIGGLFVLSLLFTTHLCRSRTGQLLRTQIVLFCGILVAAALTKGLLILTAVSPLLTPAVVLAILTALVVDLSAALATSMLAAVVFSFLGPFDAASLAILAVQSVTAVIVLGERLTRRQLIVAGVLSGIAASMTYMLLYYVAWHVVPMHELETPLTSSWLAATIAGPLGAFLAIALESPMRLALGGVTTARLVALSDLKNPLLQQISKRSPGTWQHSLAMANMAEIAANAIGADGRLIRVGAYYHDLGKSLEPSFFIENLKAGEASPHDSMEPQASAEAIFNHVTEGVRLARKKGLPERIVDFMHMHHGDGLLEYFWSKCQKQGNPHGLTENDFRYPGVPPHSKETAILAIVDAVEAASRTLRKPDVRAIEQLVQRIVYGKLHLGQLDDSGLSAGDLRRISDALIETIQHAQHGRIEYPWQKEQREAERKAGAAGAAGAADASVPAPPVASEPHLTEDLSKTPRLDSLDLPRPPVPRRRRLSSVDIDEAQRSDPAWAREKARPSAADAAPEASVEEEASEVILLEQKKKRG